MYVEIDNVEILIKDYSIQMNLFGGGTIYIDIDTSYLKFINNLKKFNIFNDGFIVRESTIIENIQIKNNIRLTIVSNDISIKVLDIRDYKIGKILHKNDKLI